MKKSIFTAIAIMAFVGTSFAKTKEVKVVVNCYAQARAAYNDCRSYGMSPASSQKVANTVEANCLRKK